MNIDEIEKDLPNGNPNLSKLLEAMLNVMLTNQAMFEEIRNVQIGILKAMNSNEEFDAEEYHKEGTRFIDQRVAELMAEFANRTM